ncbi:MAG: hypothetical protein ACRC2T_10485, partial [Thermoguttaceae bacterium]
QFLLLVIFGVWLQVCNGLTQALQCNFEMYVLEITLLTGLAMQTFTRFGQSLLGPVTGRYMDRLGYFPVMFFSLIIVAVGPLFYFFSDKTCWFWVFGAAAAWIFWIGVNVGISALVLKFAPVGKQEICDQKKINNGISGPDEKNEKQKPNRAGQNMNGIALYYSAVTLSYAVFTLFGGYVNDQMKDWSFTFFITGNQWDYSHTMFFVNFCMRLFSVVFLVLVFNGVKRSPRSSVQQT